MMFLKLIAPIAAVGVWAGVASADADDLKMLEQAKISLVEAVTTAEKHVGGKAYEAEIEDDSFSPEFEVKVTKENKIFKVTIDGASGEVSRVKEK